MRKLILLLVTVVAALAVGASTAKAVVPFSGITGGGGGNGMGCVGRGGLIDSSPHYMVGTGNVSCTDPYSYVYVTVCLQKYMTGLGWVSMECVSNQGPRTAQATAYHICGYTTFGELWREYSIGSATSGGMWVYAQAISPATTYGALCW